MAQIKQLNDDIKLIIGDSESRDVLFLPPKEVKEIYRFGKNIILVFEDDKKEIYQNFDRIISGTNNKLIDVEDQDFNSFLEKLEDNLTKSSEEITTLVRKLFPNTKITDFLSFIGAEDILNSFNTVLDAQNTQETSTNFNMTNLNTSSFLNNLN